MFSGPKTMIKYFIFMCKLCLMCKQKISGLITTAFFKLASF